MPRDPGTLEIHSRREDGVRVMAVAANQYFWPPRGAPRVDDLVAVRELGDPRRSRPGRCRPNRRSERRLWRGGVLAPYLNQTRSMGAQRLLAPAGMARRAAGH